MEEQITVEAEDSRPMRDVKTKRRYFKEDTSKIVPIFEDLLSYIILGKYGG
jgi:hypothetical protein